MKRFAVVLAVASSACSLVFVEKVHVNAGKVECTESRKFPLIDAAVGVVGIVTPFLLEAMRDRAVDDVNWPLNIGLWGAGAAGAISSVIGFRRVGRCRREQEAAALTAH